MGRGKSSEVSAEQLHHALRTLTGIELDTIVGDRGRIEKILPSLETAFRVLDPAGLFKQSALEEAFVFR